MTYKEDYKIKKRLATKKWRENNPEKVKEYNKIKEQSKETKEYRKKYASTMGAINAKRWRDNNPSKAKDASLKYSYGIGVNVYNQMFVDQNGVCIICNQKEPNGRSLCVDHNHTTGEVRGLLCRPCNSAIGHFKENIEYMKQAIKYLNNSTK